MAMSELVREVAAIAIGAAVVGVGGYTYDHGTRLTAVETTQIEVNRAVATSLTTLDDRVKCMLRAEIKDSDLEDCI